MKKLSALLLLLLSLTANAQMNYYSGNITEWDYAVMFDPYTPESGPAAFRIKDTAYFKFYSDTITFTQHAVRNDGEPAGALWLDSLGNLQYAPITPGQVKLVAYTTPDTGWLTCDGAAVSRTTYAALFSKIGTTHGVGDGTTTFNLPNLTAPGGCAYIVKY